MSTEQIQHPKVGVGVFLFHQGKVLLGKRRGSHGAGRWALPGGHLEFGERWEDCALREIFEETGLNIDTPSFVGVTNDVMSAENKHYITIYLAVESKTDQVALLEPERCESWQWFAWDAFPEQLFIPLQNFRNSQFAESVGRLAAATGAR